MKSLLTSLGHRLRSHLGLKIVLFLVLPGVTTAVYLVVQRVVLFPPRVVPLTALDRWIPFQPQWVWGYISLYLLMPIAPLLSRSRDDLLAYTRGMILCFAFACACFLLFPVFGPRPMNASGPAAYMHLIGWDRPCNAFPSLHAACAVFSVLYAQRISRNSSRIRLRLALIIVAWCWVAVILYSTLATKQHYFADLPAGAALGWMVQRWIWRDRPKRSNAWAAAPPGMGGELR